MEEKALDRLSLAARSRGTWYYPANNRLTAKCGSGEVHTGLHYSVGGCNNALHYLKFFVFRELVHYARLTPNLLLKNKGALCNRLSYFA